MGTVQANNRTSLVVAGLLIGIFVAAMDNTIVATAMGSIVGELGGLDKFVWATSAYMAAEMAGMPVFGKLSDMYGRKRFFVFGLLVFLLGSILCGTAQTIVQLSIYRAIQGIGGGALIPIAFTIMFDIFPPEKRGKMGGLFGAVFGLSSIFGPLLGAYVTDYLDWRWVFYINIPLGIVAFFLITRYYRESVTHAKQYIDWAGAATLIGAVVSLMFALELGGTFAAWNSPLMIGLFVSFGVLVVLFLFAESRAVEPIVSFAMFRNKLFAASNLIALLSGAAFVVATVYIPIYIQGVQGGSATNSGLLLLPMMLGTTVSAQVGGILSAKWSYRRVMLLFLTIFVGGIALLATLTVSTSSLFLTLFMVVTGLGIGATFSVLGMAAIHAFDDTRRGAANATLGFLRSLGMTIGITVFGMLQRNTFSNKMADAMGDAGSGNAMLTSADPRQLLAPEARAAMPSEWVDTITSALSSSIATTFVWTLIPAVLAWLCVSLMTKERLLAHPPSASRSQASSSD